MTELPNDNQEKKKLLKELILKLHDGEAPGEIKNQLKRVLGKVPYKLVTEAEQELINEGLDVGEILKLCDIHSEVLKGNIEHSGKIEAPSGHPVHTFLEENIALKSEIRTLEDLFADIAKIHGDVKENINTIKSHFNNLGDIEKHYQRKENLVFPYLEGYNITGPPKVMWGKHDEVRELLNTSRKTINDAEFTDKKETESLIKLVFIPAIKAIREMIFKEEEILFPMCMDTLKIEDWYEIYEQSPDIGYCLVAPESEWHPKNLVLDTPKENISNKIRLKSGSFTIPELNSILNTIPFDLTFVDSDDKVRYFSEGKERIFPRNRAVLGRKVQFCHPPKSVHIVDQILSDFKSGKHEKASFWITMNERFLVIEYHSLLDEDGKYLGCLEVSQDLTQKKTLKGQKKLLSYEENE